jgi:hypothetical protein
VLVGRVFVVAVVAVPWTPLPWYGFHDDGGMELMSSASRVFELLRSRVEKGGRVCEQNKSLVDS